MTDYIITEAKLGSNGAPLGSVIIGEAKFTADDGTWFYMSLEEIDGIPVFFRTPESTFEKQLIGDNEFLKELNGFSLDLGEYIDVLEPTGTEMDDICRFLIYLVRSDGDIAEDFIKNTDGKHISEIDIPASDIEEELMKEEE